MKTYQLGLVEYAWRHVNSDIEELDKQHETVALILTTMKYLELDNRITNDLSMMKKKVLDNFGAD
ncbi:hypothetical protein CsSME_00027545 [Camellia sinensis var. sinensis]